jgi:hypothetical protein
VEVLKVQMTFILQKNRQMSSFVSEATKKPRSWRGMQGQLESEGASAGLSR